MNFIVFTGYITLFDSLSFSCYCANSFPVLEIKAKISQPGCLLSSQESTNWLVTRFCASVCYLFELWTLWTCLLYITNSVCVDLTFLLVLFRPSEQRYYTQLGKVVRNTQNAIAELHQQQECLPLVDVFRSSLEEVRIYTSTLWYMMQRSFGKKSML